MILKEAVARVTRETGWAAIGVLIASALSIVFSSLPFNVPPLRVALGLSALLFGPGLMWSFVVFPSTHLALIERMALSFAASLVIVPLTIYGLSKVGVPISPLSVSTEVFAICLIGYVSVVLRTSLKRVA